MKIATLLFTYNRSHHTERTIEGLKNNTVLPQKLYVFQDGLKEGMDDSEWKKVNRLINSIDWCDKEIIVSQCNKGLAESIVSGINYAFRDYDAVIVLEDDCVATSNFMSFMQQCFEKYRDNREVYSVSGYSYPFHLKKVQYDIYGCGRISSWGWGTWKDRWNIFEKDYEIVKKMKKNPEDSVKLAMWGRDLEEMLAGNVRGDLDSWAVFWALNIIAREGICINPYESLITNIGTDGSGVHCSTTDKYKVDLIDEKKEDFSLPDKIDILDETREAFAPLYGSYTAVSREDAAKETILLYGLGYYFKQNEKKVNEQYNIRAFVDRRKRGWFAGKKIIKANEISSYDYDKILVMIQDAKECDSIVKNLIEQGIDGKKILTGRSFCEGGKLIDGQQSVGEAIQVKANRLDRGFERYQTEFEEKALNVLRSGWYVLGKEVTSFEREFAAFTGAEYCVGVGSGLDALWLAVRALGIGPGDEVIVQGNTYIASVMGITMNGAIPVFVEPDEFYQIDAGRIEEKITSRTKAVMVVHLYGQVAVMDEITALCRKHKIRLIEDCAQSHAACFKDKMTGTFGDTGCFSFYPSKNLGGFGEGGAVITNDEQTADMIRILRNYGSEKRYYNKVIGTNSRLDELQAGLLRVRLSHIEEITGEREWLANNYSEKIKNSSVILPEGRKGTRTVWHQYVIRTKARDKFQSYLKQNGVDTMIHYPVPPHLAQAYQYLGYHPGDLPVTEKYAQEVLSLPMYSGMTEEEQDWVIKVINQYGG